MKPIIRILSKLLMLIILVFAGLCGLFLAAEAGKLNHPLKKALEYFLSINGVNAEFIDFKFQNNTISSKEVRISSRDDKLLISDLFIHTTYFDRTFEFILDPSRIRVVNNNNELIADAEYSGKFVRTISGGEKYSELKLTNVSFFNLKDINNQPYSKGLITYINGYWKQKHYVVVDLNFDNSTYFHAGSDQDSSNIKITGKNIPLQAYTIFEKIAPSNSWVAFFREFIKNGYVAEADFTLNMDKKPLADGSLFGKAKIQKLDFCYDKDFPQLKNMDVDIDVLDSNITFKINSAYSSSILLSDGIIKMNWLGIDDTILKITAKAHGDAKGLTDFIHEVAHNAMQKAGINLRQIVGKVDSDIYIDIPLKPGTKNTYNITANITEASLSIFKDHINLTDATLAGVFNGNQVLINGTGKINDFKSNLDFALNLSDQTQFSHKLDIKTYFKIAKKDTGIVKKIAFVSFLGGDSVIDFTYQNKDSKGIISAHSDITGLDLYFDKLGIRKTQNDKSRLIINGTFTDPTKGLIDFSVSSQSGLKTNGIISIEPDKITTDIKEIKYKETNLSAKILLYKDLFDANISGKALDLSDANMLQFLEKERDNGSTKLALNIGRVKMKDNIWLDNVKMKFECDSLRCFSGYIDSKIGSKPLELLLSAKGNQENWLIKCGNAGALLRSLDMYNSMRSGNLTLNITTSRHKVKLGQIIPIYSGRFYFERFILHDAPTMTRLISFISFPGFISMISGNKDISFSDMSGNFSFQNNILTVDNSAANGPYLRFTLQGNLDTKKRFMDIKGHVNPELYGVSPIIGSIPIVGRIFTGNEKHQGLLSKSYKLKESY